MRSVTRHPRYKTSPSSSRTGFEAINTLVSQRKTCVGGFDYSGAETLVYRTTFCSVKLGLGRFDCFIDSLTAASDVVEVESGSKRFTLPSSAFVVESESVR